MGWNKAEDDSDVERCYKPIYSSGSRCWESFSMLCQRHQESRKCPRRFVNCSFQQITCAIECSTRRPWLRWAYQAHRTFNSVSERAITQRSRCQTQVYSKTKNTVYHTSKRWILRYPKSQRENHIRRHRLPEQEVQATIWKNESRQCQVSRQAANADITAFRQNRWIGERPESTEGLWERNQSSTCWVW